MVEKVYQLDAGIKALTQEMRRKVSIDELALYMGMTEDEIEDFLRLMGEDSEEDMEEES
jgi:DNA-directed RNA polymerase sigma subunit (sigma70/sigma32)